MLSQFCVSLSMGEPSFAGTLASAVTANFSVVVTESSDFLLWKFVISNIGLAVNADYSELTLAIELKA